VILRRLAAEGLGTAALLCAVVGSGIMAERLSGGNVGVALLANTAATGAILYVLIVMLGPISGAHFNPAVTLMFAVRRQIGAGMAAAYATVQAAGGVAGAWLAHLMFEEPVFQLAKKLRDGPAQWLSEAVAAFGLVLTILGGLRWAPERVPGLVALYICAAYWFTASTSFANPAAALARMLSDSFAGIAPGSVLPFVAAQLLGALLATAAGGWLFKPEPAR